MTDSACLKDHFLIALPTLQDPNFSRSVTYLCEHTEGGAMGLVINRPAPLTLADILEHMQIEVKTDALPEIPVFTGGPVQAERGFLLHTPPGHWQSSLQVTDRLAVTTSRDILQAIARGEGPEQVLITLGYAGWGPGQLEAELAQDAWLVAPASETLLFETPVDERWSAAAALAGVDLNLLSPTAGHA